MDILLALLVTDFTRFARYGFYSLRSLHLLALLVTDAARCVPTWGGAFYLFCFFTDAARCVPTGYSVLRMGYCFFIIRK